MQKSESIKNVMAALGVFQAKAVKIRKDSTNPHFKSKYASLAVILDEIQPHLTEAKLVFTQIPEESSHLITLLVHPESGEFIEAKYELKSVQQTPQGIGSAITYARRYSLTSILGLNIDDDDDGNEASRERQPAQQQQHGNQQSSNSQQNGAQHAPPQSPFNKAYADAPALLAVIKTANTMPEITAIYTANTDLVEKNQQIKDAMAARRDAIKNQGKVIITDGQFKQVCDRIAKGDATCYESAVKVYILSQARLEQLQQLEKERALFEEALKTKYNNPADIATMIDQCKTEAHITRLHSNNAMIIDRDADLMTKMNARTRIIKSAA